MWRVCETSLNRMRENGMLRRRTLPVGATVFAFAILLASPTLGHQRGSSPTPQKRSQQSAAELYADLAFQGPNWLFGNVSDGLTAEARWKKMLTDSGLRPRTTVDSQWNFADATGEVRATALFDSDKVSFWLMFFPAGQERLSEAVLSHLLAKATRSSLEDADTLEIDLPARSLTGNPAVDSAVRPGCRGQEVDTMALRLTGVLYRRSKIITCAK
jgi:hypothetical protein